jgi:uncharacterized membrane protein YccF (DUF307 family)
MRFIGNIIWLLFGGLMLFFEYLLNAILFCVTIIGIPFGLQLFKLALLSLWPFGKSIYTQPTNVGCLWTIMNIIWFLTGGIWVFLTHLFFGIVLCVTIVGIPWGKQHFKLMGLALAPFNKTVV